MGVRIFFALLTLSILGLAIASFVYIRERVEKPKVEVARELKEAEPPKPIDPGIREFDEALKLAENRQLVAARDKLRYIIRYFPRSARRDTAAALCKEINLDLLVSPNFTESKMEYEVERGDSLSAIAAKHDTTIEYLKRLNGMMDFKILPGDQIQVRSLNFSISVNTKSKELILKESDEFFGAYPIQSLTLPKGLRLPYEDSVRSKQALAGESVVTTTQDGYDLAHKEIRLRKARLSIRGLKPSEANDQPKAGIVMDPADVEELTMLIRVNSPIQVL